MKIPLALKIGLRYTYSGRRGHGYVSFVSLVSVVSIALGVFALIVVQSVMNGFQKEVRDKMLSLLSHIEVMTPSHDLVDWQPVAKKATAIPHVLAAAPFVLAQGLVSGDDELFGVIVRGIEPEPERLVSDALKKFKQGSLNALEAGAFNIVVSEDLAASMHVKLGDYITLIAPQGQTTPAGVVPRTKQFKLVGLYNSGHAELDKMMVFIHANDAQKMFRLVGMSGVRLKVDEMTLVPNITEQLAPQVQALNPELYVRDWTTQNSSWYSAVKTEKLMMFIINMLITLVAAFNLVSMLVIMVVIKRPDIAILRTFGATPRTIQTIFLIQGGMIGFVGVGVGLSLGLLVAHNVGDIVAYIEHTTKTVLLPRDMYLLAKMPSDIQFWDVFVISGSSFLMTLLAAIYPSWRAARLNPAEALRYE